MKRTLLMLLLTMPVLARAQTASFTVSADTVCQDSCITLVNTSTGSTDSIRWVIQGYTPSIAHNDTVTVCILPAGFDTIELYTYSGGSVDSAVNVVVTPATPILTNAYVSLILGPTGWIVTVKASISPLGELIQYQWAIDSVLIPGATDSVFTDSSACFHLITCIASLSNVCTPILANSKEFVCEGAVHSVNAQNDIKLYPNPAATQITIKTQNPINQVTISNVVGLTVYSNEYNVEQVQIDISALPAGLYFVKVNGSEVRKFVKEWCAKSF